MFFDPHGLSRTFLALGGSRLGGRKHRLFVANEEA